MDVMYSVESLGSQLLYLREAVRPLQRLTQLIASDSELSISRAVLSGYDMCVFPAYVWKSTFDNDVSPSSFDFRDGVQGIRLVWQGLFPAVPSY